MSLIKNHLQSLEEEIQNCNLLEYQLYCQYQEIKERYGDVEELLDFFSPLMEEE